MELKEFTLLVKASMIGYTPVMNKVVRGKVEILLMQNTTWPGLFMPRQVFIYLFGFFW